MNRNDLHKIARIRLQEAETLFNAKQFDGAYYLAGYAIECALKACIAKETRQYDFPDKQIAAKAWVHDLKELRRIADLEDQFVKDAATIVGLVDSWNIVSEWSEKFRYIHRTTNTTAAEMLAAVSDRTIGILPWLEKYWQLYIKETQGITQKHDALLTNKGENKWEAPGISTNIGK